MKISCKCRRYLLDPEEVDHVEDGIPICNQCIPLEKINGTSLQFELELFQNAKDL